MSSVRHQAWGLALVLWVSPARADDDCGTAFADCKDDCSLEYGSIRVEMKRLFAKCMKDCEQGAERCADLQNEMRVEQGARDKSSRDDSGTSAPKHKAKAKKKRATVEGGESEDARAPRREPQGEGEVPKSSRTAITTDEKPASTKPTTGASDDQLEPLAPLNKPVKGAESEAAQPEKEKASPLRPKAPPKKEEEDDLRND